MKTHSRGVAGRIISFILVLVMIMSMWSVGILPATAADVDLSESSADLGADSLSSVGASGVGGDSTLFDKVDSTEPYVIAEKDKYYMDEPILVTADHGTRLALYKNSVTAPTSTDVPIYTLDLSGHEGQTVDLRMGTYNADSDAEHYLAYTTYNLFLFADDAYTVAAQTQIVMRNGNNTRVDDTTFLETNRKTFVYGEQILVRAKADKNPNAWVGLYPAGTDTSTKAPDYILYIGTGYSTNYSGETTNLIKKSVVNTGADLEAGTYDLHLFSDKLPTSTKLLSTTINVQYGIAATDKDTYGYGENIITKNEIYDPDSITINNTLYLTGEGVGHRSEPSTSSGTRYASIPEGTVVNVVRDCGGSADNNWAYITYNSKNGYTTGAYLDRPSDSDIKMFGTTAASNSTYSYVFSSRNTGSSYRLTSKLAKGAPFSFMANYNTNWFTANLGGYSGHMYRGGQVSTSYVYINYEIHNNSDKPAVDSTHSRVALYQSSVTPASGATGYGYYYVNKVNNSAVVIQNADNGRTLEPNSYTFHLFGDSSYTDAATHTVTVSENVTGAFINGAYQVDNLSDGFANGRVALELDNANSYGYAGVGANAVVYWAGSDGKPLAGYNSFAKVPLNKNVVAFDMHPYSIIPEGATGLVAYVEFNGVEGTTGYVIDLPTDCKTYTDLDGEYTEFQIIADAQLSATEIEYDCNSNFESALTDIANNSPSSTGIFISGDVTYTGTVEDFALVDSIKASVESSTGKTIPSVYASIGDSDHYDANVGVNAFVDFVNSHGGEVSADKLYYSKMIGGYKYIFLACDETNNEISDAQLQWLDAELADNEENNDGKPVFIMLHDILSNTIATPYATINNTDEFAAVAKKYNNVFVFSGHNLYDVSSVNSIFGGDANLPVVVGSGAVGFSRYFSGSAYGESNDAVSTGYYVRVYDDKVVLMGRDFLSGKWIPEAFCVLYNQDVTVTKDDVALSLTESIKGTEYIKNDNNRTLTFESSDDKVVTVAANGDVTPVAVGDDVPTYVHVNVSAAATDTEVVTRAKLPLRIFETIDRNYYVRGSFDDWTDGVVMQRSLDDEDLVTATLNLMRGTYEFNLNNFETWYEKAVVINDATEAGGIVLDSRIERITTLQATEPANITLKAIGGTYEFEYRISTKTLNVYYSPLEDEGGVAGDSELIDKVTSAQPYVHASKEEYKLGESIYITADHGVWVGIYAADETDYASTYSSYWYYVEGFEGKPLDIRTLAKNSGSSATIDPIFYTGSYQAVLFGTNDQSKVLDTVYFDVVGSNSNAVSNNSLSTDRDTYYYGEPIMVTGWTNRPDLKPWVCLVPRGETPASNNLLYWHYLADGTINRMSIPCDLVKTSDVNTNVAVEPGEYDVWLYRTSSYGYPSCKVEITIVDGGGTVSTNKTTYGRYEDIIVTANYRNYTPGAWVGIYDESVLNGKNPTGGSGLKGWYYIDDQASYTVVMQDLETGDVSNCFTTAEAVPGEYSVYLFGDSGYTKIQDKTSFTIEENVTGAFSSGVYLIDKVYDGFANGKIILELSDDSCGYIDAADATVYWADENGKPLEGYTALPKAYVDSTVVILDMNSHTIIPKGAKSLVAYLSSYDGTISTEGLKIDLPAGCIAYTGLENGIVAKFNLITDTHLTSDEVTHYANGLAKYHSWQQDTSNEYFADVLKDIAAQSPDSLGIFINGDVTNNGFAEEYAQADSIYNAVESQLGVELPPMYAAVGNHDTFIGSTATYVDFVNNHGGNITSDAPYYSKTIGGYKFIFLAGDNPDYYGYKTAVINSGDAELSDTQLAWLDAELKDNEENNEGKPVFLFLHQAVEDTVAGSLDGQDWDGLVNVDEFKAVVEKYNNVMLMGGHSHWVIDSPSNMYPGSNDMSVAVNLGSTSYSWTDYENAPSSTVMEAQGFYVQVYEDKTVFLGRNFTTEEWIPGACFVLYNEDVESTQTEPIKLYLDDTASAAEYISNPLDRELSYKSSDPSIIKVSADGTITAVGVGEAEVFVTAAATNTEVLTRTKIAVKVNPFAGAATSYYLKGDFNDWGDSLNMTQSRVEDVVTTTVELAQGTYQFKINSGNDWYGNTGTIEDTTEATSEIGWEMSASEQTNCTLKATGGTYTFNFNTSTKMLVITFERASEEETGEKTATIYVDYTNSSFTETPYIYIWDPNDTSPNNNIGELWPGKKLEGPNEEGYYYRTFKYDEAYQFIINDGAGVQTADSAVHTESEVYVTFTDGVEYKEGKPPKFWIDLNPEDDSSKIDLLYPELIDGVYYFFLPAGFNAKAAEFHKTEGTTLTITRIQIKDEGSTFNLLSGVNKNRSYVLGGDYSGKFMVKQSSNVSSVYTYTKEMVPQGTGYGDHKDDYTTSGSIMMMNSDASIRLATTDLKKIKGRGNSTWEASNELIGKYAFNITLNEATGLINADSLGKKYSLVSYNTDEARMRNMVVYDLAEAIGVDYVADFEPVDFYNNGRYIGSYLLTDKIEIGDPLVDITDVDGINESTSEKNAQIYDEGATESDRGYVAGTGLDDVSTPGFFKYVKLDEPEASVYEKGGFLLELEINERFADETSGFISERGQQIVCKYPEYATYNEMQFIMDKWNKAEELIYKENATYEELNEVIDVESFAKMYLIQELTKNLDAGATSYFVYYDGGKLHAGVAWDYDWTLGQYIQSRDENLTVDKQTSGKFDAQANKLLNDPEGWWANSKEIYPNTGVLNAQAALCQNETFWNVVKAEWNEIFYSTAMSFVVNRVSDVSELQSNFLDYYTLVKGTTAMDEFKWGLIESDPLESWGSNDTGDTHDDATVWLNNFYYDRLQWMNGELASSDYDLAPPTLRADKDADKGEIYSLGEEVTLTATCNSSGELTYNFYDANGKLIETVKSSAGEVQYKFIATEETDGMYKVVVTSEGTTSEEAEAEVKVIAKKFDFELDVEAPEMAPAGTLLTIGAVANSESEVLYYLYDEAGEFIDANYEGVFDIMTSPDEAGTTVKYTVEAQTEINGISYTASKTVEIELVKFEFAVTLTGPESVEAGMDIVLSASAKSTSLVTYTFYDAVDHSVIGKNTLGSCIFETSKEFIGQTRSFYVVAQTQAFGKTYTATSQAVDVKITAVTDVYNVTLYFKSTSTIGYKPMITTSGAVEDVTDEYMEKDIFICKNATETASYYWYKIDIEVSKKSPSIYFRILSSRYAMEVQGNLMVTEDKTYYFAVDNLNSGTELVDLTEASEDERNWCESALHMVYDPKYDSEESLAEVTARVDLRFVGDTTADGKVNIRDATSIQKYLADLVEYNSTDREVADVDSDAKITIKDATRIQKKLVGLL